MGGGVDGRWCGWKVVWMGGGVGRMVVWMGGGVDGRWCGWEAV